MNWYQRQSAKYNFMLTLRYLNILRGRYDLTLVDNDYFFREDLYTHCKSTST